MIQDYFRSYFSSSDKTQLKKTLDNLRYSSVFSTKKIPFSELEKWGVQANGNIGHESGEFFTIMGASYHDTMTGNTQYQPLIDQPEQGILGLYYWIEDGEIRFLFQGKIEPGNKHQVQYSPTVQATRSNYTRVHKGKKVSYVDYFFDDSPYVVRRGFQSEHGHKFKGKANDNVLAFGESPEVLDSRFQSLSVADIRTLFQEEHAINMDSRSVLSGFMPIQESLSRQEFSKLLAPYKRDLHWLEEELFFSSLSSEGSESPLSSLENWVKSQKEKNRYQKEFLPLSSLYGHGWTKSEDSIGCENHPDFEVKLVRSSTDTREISSWTQPIVRDNRPKAYGMLFAMRNGTLQALVQLVEEPFSWSGAEIAPTLHGVSEKTIEGCNSEFAKYFEPGSPGIFYSRVQSEEGGRFDHQMNRYILALTEEEVSYDKECYRWVTIFQLKQIMTRECFINIEARSLVALSALCRVNSL